MVESGEEVDSSEPKGLRLISLKEVDDETFYETLSDDFSSKKSRCNFRTSIKSSDSSTRAWNIDETRKKLLKRLTLLPIGKHSFEVLSKFVINHQILEIVKVLKFGNCVDLHAKVNLESQCFSNIDSENVIIKIYQQKVGLVPDFRSAQTFKGIVCSKGRNLRPTNFSQNWYYNSDIEALTILKVGHIVFTKMIGDNKPAANLIQMIKANPKKIKASLDDLMELLKRNQEFWNSRSSTKNVLWHNDQWMIVCLQIECSQKRTNFLYAANVYATLKVFLRFGTPRDVLLKSINTVFPRMNQLNRCSNNYWTQNVSEKLSSKFE